MFCTTYPMFTVSVGGGETERFLMASPARLFLPQEFLRANEESKETTYSGSMLVELRPVAVVLPNSW